MKLRAPILEIPTDDPFRHDILGRKKIAETLTEFILSSNEPLVLCINAPWGEGKSTFLAMWRQMLINQNFKTLYFNAWENDFSDDAFVSLIGELELGITELSLDPNNASAVHEHLKKAKKIGSSLIKHAIPTAVKIATAGLVDIDGLSNEALAQYCEKLAEEQIKQYEDSKKSVVEFKEQLSALATKVSGSDDEAEPHPPHYLD